MKLERHSHNPILAPNPAQAWESGAVFNCGAVVGEDGLTYLLYRAIAKGYSRSSSGGGYDDYVSSVGCATSEDGIHFVRGERPVLEPTDECDRFGCEDPRVTRLEIQGRVRYLITYTALSAPAFSGLGDRVGLASTEDLRTFRKHGVVIPAQKDKDAVILPELVGGRIVMLHRVEPNIQVVYFDDWEQLVEPDQDRWSRYSASIEEHTIMRPEYEWEANKIGAGPPPIKTNAGWLLIYHGVDANYVYRAGAALLDLEDPSRIIARSPQPILEPEKEYERIGDVPNVVFPVGAVVQGGTLYVYYGGADKCCCLATAPVDELTQHLLESPRPAAA